METVFKSRFRKFAIVLQLVNMSWLIWKLLSVSACIVNDLMAIMTYHVLGASLILPILKMSRLISRNYEWEFCLEFPGSLCLFTAGLEIRPWKKLKQIISIFWAFLLHKTQFPANSCPLSTISSCQEIVHQFQVFGSSHLFYWRFINSPFFCLAPRGLFLWSPDFPALGSTCRLAPGPPEVGWRRLVGVTQRWTRWSSPHRTPHCRSQSPSSFDSVTPTCSYHTHTWKIPQISV